MKKEYVKPEASKMAFSPEEMLMASGVTPGGGTGDGPGTLSLDDKSAFQIFP